MKYPYIYAWGKNLGSFNYYIQEQINLAEKENAPERAIYRRDTGEWIIIDEIENIPLRDFLIKHVEGEQP